jgi:hypothetical protein
MCIRLCLQAAGGGGLSGIGELSVMIHSKPAIYCSRGRVPAAKMCVQHTNACAHTNMCFSYTPAGNPCAEACMWLSCIRTRRSQGQAIAACARADQFNALVGRGEVPGNDDSCRVAERARDGQCLRVGNLPERNSPDTRITRAAARGRASVLDGELATRNRGTCCCPRPKEPALAAAYGAATRVDALCVGRAHLPGSALIYVRARTLGLVVPETWRTRAAIVPARQAAAGSTRSALPGHHGSPGARCCRVLGVRYTAHASVVAHVVWEEEARVIWAEDTGDAAPGHLDEQADGRLALGRACNCGS